MASQSDGKPHGQMFIKEIKQMMFIFGDVKTPSADSALLIEDIVLKQMRDLIKRASEICEKQRRTNITITDIMFLYRKNMKKLKRIVKHIELKELCRRTSVFDEDSSNSVDGVSVNQGNKKNNFSLDFLSDFDQEEVYSEEVDNAQRRRLESLDILTKNMNAEEYAEFAEARHSGSFHKNLTRFKEWLDLPNLFPMVTINPNVFSLLGYLAYDTVQEVVELAMLIKHNHEGHLIQSFHRPPSAIPEGPPSTPLFFNVSSPNPDTTAAPPIVVSTSSPSSSPVKSPSGGSVSSPTNIITKPKPRKRGRPPKNSTSSTISEPVATPPIVATPSAPITALQPFHITEAIRRRSSDLPKPMTPFKSYFS